MIKNFNDFLTEAKHPKMYKALASDKKICAIVCGPEDAIVRSEAYKVIGDENIDTYRWGEFETNRKLKKLEDISQDLDKFKEILEDTKKHDLEKSVLIIAINDDLKEDKNRTFLLDLMLNASYVHFLGQEDDDEE